MSAVSMTGFAGDGGGGGAEKPVAGIRLSEEIGELPSKARRDLAEKVMVYMEKNFDNATVGQSANSFFDAVAKSIKAICDENSIESLSIYSWYKLFLKIAGDYSIPSYLREYDSEDDSEDDDNPQLQIYHATLEMAREIKEENTSEQGRSLRRQRKENKRQRKENKRQNDRQRSRQGESVEAQSRDLGIALGVLGLSENYTESELRQAYKKKSLQWHPDKNLSPEAKERFQEINNANAFLKKLRAK